MAGSLSSAEIERDFPFPIAIIFRSHWLVQESLAVNQFLGTLCGGRRRGDFNRIRRYRFARQDDASRFSEFILSHRYDRLSADCPGGSSREEVAAEWVRIGQDRQAILAWARQHHRLQEVVQEYRFSRRAGDPSTTAHENAGLVVRKADPSIADPMNTAGVLIEWAEREHRDWFWRCCRHHHVL
ncbi:MAG TPA: hypothetical protein VLA02_11545 [Reyranella sp.]|nr:hypothetical protein [Reyranella sp.]